MYRYEIKFYCNGTLLTTNSDDDKKYLMNEFNRFSKMEIEEIVEELGLNENLTVTYILLMDNKTEKILKEKYF